MLILGLIVFGMAVGWIAQLILGRTGHGNRNWAEALIGQNRKNEMREARFVRDLLSFLKHLVGLRGRKRTPKAVEKVPAENPRN